jgi:hypothetical protein
MMGQICNTDVSDTSGKIGHDHLEGLGSQWPDDAGTLEHSLQLFLVYFCKQYQKTSK